MKLKSLAEGGETAVGLSREKYYPTIRVNDQLPELNDKEIGYECELFIVATLKGKRDTSNGIEYDLELNKIGYIDDGEYDEEE